MNLGDFDTSLSGETTRKFSQVSNRTPINVRLPDGTEVPVLGIEVNGHCSPIILTTADKKTCRMCGEETYKMSRQNPNICVKCSLIETLQQNESLYTNNSSKPQSTIASAESKG